MSRKAYQVWYSEEENREGDLIKQVWKKNPEEIAWPTKR
jgi:hypothetical protein